MTLKELKKRLNELSSELDDLPVWAEVRGHVAEVEPFAILINEEVGADCFLPQNWDYDEWSEYFQENVDKQIILIL